MLMLFIYVSIKSETTKVSLYFNEIIYICDKINIYDNSKQIKEIAYLVNF